MYIFLLLYSFVVFSYSIQFWEDSVHDGTRIEILTNLRYLNQTIVIAGSKRNKNPYPEYFEDKGIIYPPEIPRGQGDDRYFFSLYRNKTIMIETDAFICTFPVSHCESFLPFNKSIIWLAAHGYAINACSQTARERYDKIFKATVQDGGNKPYVFLGAMNDYDVQYINYYTGLTPILLETTALLYGAKKLSITQFVKKYLLVLLREHI